MVPSSISELVAAASVVGFSGSRSPAAGAPAAVAAVAGFVSPSAVVVVGCARGVDEIARELFTEARVFSVASGDYGKGKSAFARRSIACVEACKGGLWISFPASSCPPGLIPKKSAFTGYGSGSWSSLSYALALEIRSVLWLPPSVSPPAGWGLVAAGGGWFLSAPPSSVQLSLF
ncbi:MAG: hypothetical protein AB4057_00350 [Crocosphaera sp.]